jgi:hypothetical protein
MADGSTRTSRIKTSSVRDGALEEGHEVSVEDAERPAQVLLGHAAENECQHRRRLHPLQDHKDLLVAIIGFHLLMMEVPTFLPPALGMVSVGAFPAKWLCKSVQLQSGIEE